MNTGGRLRVQGDQQVMGVLLSPLSSCPLPGDTSIASLHPGQGTGSCHPVLRAPAASAQTPISSVPAWCPVPRCHGATRHVLTTPSRGTAAHALLMACRCPHSSSGGSLSTFTITMFVSTEQTGGASSWSPGPGSCGEWRPIPRPHQYPTLSPQERQRAAQP